jgi:hypothetical protein
MVVVVMAKWCGACHIIGPVLPRFVESWHDRFPTDCIPLFFKADVDSLPVSPYIFLLSFITLHCSTVIKIFYLPLFLCRKYLVAWEFSASQPFSSLTRPKWWASTKALILSDSLSASVAVRSRSGCIYACGFQFSVFCP